MSPAKFRSIVWKYYHAHGRHTLPWRKTKNSYRILVSEVMLQQTQVDRVIPFYNVFIKKFGTAQKLADAPLSEVLKSWQGLGYNRRAKMLREAAHEIVARKIRTIAEWESLPGVGPYTARAIAAFAYNEDVIFVETNIRTAIIHHFFAENTTIYGSVSDSQIEEILRNVLPKGRAREWYGALMDYGAHLKRSGISHNAKSDTYARQSKFAGSNREARGAILRELAKGDATRARLINALGISRQPQAVAALDALLSEGLVRKARGRYSLAE
ncbi:MAG: A/G-specific adenine glycosylase [Minisyncoccia bacterium]